MLVGWKTTLFAVLTVFVSGWQLIGSPLLDADPTTLPQYTAFITTALTALGLHSARDYDSSSENEKIK